MKDVTLSLTDQRGEEEVKEEFHYENGVQDFVDYLNEDKDTLTPVLYFAGEQDSFQVEVALQYNDGYSKISFLLLTMFGQRMAEHMKLDLKRP